MAKTLLSDAVGYNEPNDATKKSIEEAKKEKSSLKRYKDGNDFLAEIENEL